MGQVILTFADPPGITRDDVVLPAAVLARIERHALGWPRTSPTAAQFPYF